MIMILGVLFVALLVFWAGTAVGYKQAAFSYHWNDNYSRQFGGPRSPLGFQSDSDEPMSAHGAFGTIIGVKLPEIVVKGGGDVEKTVTVNGATVIRRFHDAASTTDLSNGQTVVVIGEPDSQGNINASLIRIVPPMPANQ